MRSVFPPVPCEVDRCNAPYNFGCKNMHGEAVCICPECEDILDPVCSSDGVQDRSKCMVMRQSCLVGREIRIARESPCGKFQIYDRLEYSYFGSFFVFLSLLVRG